jgi:hypothetical protein
VKYNNSHSSKQQNTCGGSGSGLDISKPPDPGSTMDPGIYIYILYIHIKPVLQSHTIFMGLRFQLHKYDAAPALFETDILVKAIFE